jgi:hypothetical protein
VAAGEDGADPSADGGTAWGLVAAGEEGVNPLTDGVITAVRPGAALATTAANTPVAAMPAAPIQRVIREIRFRP